MYAYIKFVEDGIFATVDIKNIRRFDPNCLIKDKKYMVKWSDDDYYPAIVIYVKETKQEIQDEVQKKRVATKPLSLYASATEDSEEDGSVEPSVSINKKKLHKQVVLREANKKISQQKCDTDILSEYYKEKIPEKKSCENSKENSKDIQKTNMDLCNSRDAEFTENGIIKNFEKRIEEKEMEISKLLDKTKVQKKMILELSDKNKDQELQIVELTKLNISLQKDVVTAIAELTEKFKGIDVNNLANQNGLMEIGQIVGDQVHIGQGILLGKSQFDACYVLAKTASKFAKDIALAVFGVETLRMSSVTGRKGNKLDKLSKPPLDPTKLQAVVDIFIYYKKKKGETVLDLKKETEYVKAYITSKISDLNRQPRALTGNKTIKRSEAKDKIETEIETETGVKEIEKREERDECDLVEDIDDEGEEIEDGETDGDD